MFPCVENVVFWLTEGCGNFIYGEYTGKCEISEKISTAQNIPLLQYIRMYQTISRGTTLS